MLRTDLYVELIPEFGTYSNTPTRVRVGKVYKRRPRVAGGFPVLRISLMVDEALVAPVVAVMANAEGLVKAT